MANLQKMLQITNLSQQTEIAEYYKREGQVKQVKEIAENSVAHIPNTVLRVCSPHSIYRKDMSNQDLGKSTSYKNPLSCYVLNSSPNSRDVQGYPNGP
jgi:hypothetical protein